jgi:hypothetical protein
MFIIKNIKNTYVKFQIHSFLYLIFQIKLVPNDIKALCNLPMIRGNCDQQISRWYYNAVDQYCYSYQYTGCRKY